MKGCRKFISLLVFTVFILGMFLIKETFAADKILCVDFLVVFNDYEKTKDNDVKLEETQKAKQKEIDTKVDEIKKLQDKLSVLSEQEKKKKQEEIDSKTKDLQEFTRTAEIDLKKDREDKLKEIVKDIQDAVDAIAKEKGCDFIVDKRMLLYANSALDVSKNVLDNLNNSYKKKK